MSAQNPLPATIMSYAKSSKLNRRYGSAAKLIHPETTGACTPALGRTGTGTGSVNAGVSGNESVRQRATYVEFELAISRLIDNLRGKRIAGADNSSRTVRGGRTAPLLVRAARGAEDSVVTRIFRASLRRRVTWIPSRKLPDCFFQAAGIPFPSDAEF